jgi:hypothetical protein
MPSAIRSASASVPVSVRYTAGSEGPEEQERPDAAERRERPAERRDLRVLERDPGGHHGARDYRLPVDGTARGDHDDSLHVTA